MPAVTMDKPSEDLPAGLAVLIDPAGVRRRTVRIEIVILLVASVLMGLHCLYFFNQTCDDGYISLAYARRWVQGRGLSLNDVAPSEGYSNLSWVMLLAAGMKVGLDGVLFAKLLGLGCAVGVSIVGVRLARQTGGGLWAQLAAGVFIAGATPLAAWSVQCLETSFYTLQVAALALFAGRLRHTGGRVGFALTAGLMAITRPEGLIVAGGLCIFLLILSRRGSSWRQGVVWGLIFLAAVILVHQVFRLGTFGRWVGNSAIHKWHPGMVLKLAERGADRLRLWTSFYWSHPWPLLWAVLVVPMVGRRTRRRLFPTTSLLVATGAFHLLVGGDLGPYFRFLAPTTALIAVLLSRIGVLAPPWTWTGRILRPTGPILAMALGVLGCVQMLQWIPLPSNFYACPSVVRPTAHAEVADWLKRHAQPGDRVLCSEMGLIPYATDLPCFDYLGLCDRFMYAPGIQFHPERYDQFQPAFVVMNVNALADGKTVMRLPSQAQMLAQPGFLQTFKPAVEFTLDKTRSLMAYGYYGNRPWVREVRFVIFARTAPATR